MIIFMGAAGAGKSLQGGLLARDLSYEWISTGEYLRNNITEDRKNQMLSGKLISDEEIIEIMQYCFETANDQKRIIVDGFPRTIKQAEWLVGEQKKGNIFITAIIFLDVNKETAVARLIGRGRDDDKEEIIEKRYRDYINITLPIINWLKEQGIVVHDINANDPLQVVHQNIVSKLGKT